MRLRTIERLVVVASLTLVVVITSDASMSDPRVACTPGPC